MLRAHFTSCHPLSVKKGFVKGETLRILRKNSSETTLRKIIQISKKKTLDGKRLPTNFDRKPTIRNKIHRKEVSTPKTKQQGGKRNIVIRDTIPTLSVYYRVFSLTWPASMQIYWNKRKRLHKKRVQLPQDGFGTPSWPLFHCFGTPIWLPWRHVKTLYKGSLNDKSGSYSRPPITSTNFYRTTYHFLTKKEDH